MIVSAETMRDIVQARTFEPNTWLLSPVRVVLKVLLAKTSPFVVYKLSLEHQLSRCIVFLALPSLLPLTVLSFIHQIPAGIIKPALRSLSFTINKITL